MAPRRTLSRAARATLKERNVPPAALTPLLDAGIPEDVAVRLACTRVDAGWDVAILADDALLHAALGDLDLLEQFADAGHDPADALDDLHGTVLNTAALKAAITQDICYPFLRDWMGAGHPADTLRPVAQATGMAVRTVALAAAGGATISELEWVAARTDDYRWVHLAGFDGPLRQPDQGPCRRLALAILVRGHSPEIATAIAAAVDGAPWAETAATLVIDGGDITEAIRLARADQRIEQERTRTLSGTRARAAGRGR